VNAPITIPMIDGYYNGEKVYFLHTEVSDKPMAEMMSMMVNFPTLYVPELMNISPDDLGKVYIFTNGIPGTEPYGGGPFFFQIDIFDAIPGQSDRNWDAQKSKILNKLFQSWADLIYFLESIAENAELQEYFEKDLKELFEVKPDYKVKQLSPFFGVEKGGMRIQETAFARFVFASLIPHEDDSENFRLKLLHTLQSVVYAKAWWILTKTIDPHDIITKSALENLLKSFEWTYYISKSTKDYTEDASRFIKFPAPYKASLRTKKKKN